MPGGASGTGGAASALDSSTMTGAGCGASALKDLRPGNQAGPIQNLQARLGTKCRQSAATVRSQRGGASPARAGRAHFAAASPTSRGSVRRPTTRPHPPAATQLQRRQRSGEITSPRLVNTVRYQGRLRRSPSRMPTSTGFDVSCNGGRRSGAKRSAKLISSDRHREISSPSGGEKSRSNIRFTVCSLRPGAGRRGITLLHRVVLRDQEQLRVRAPRARYRPASYYYDPTDRQSVSSSTTVNLDRASTPRIGNGLGEMWLAARRQW